MAVNLDLIIRAFDKASPVLREADTTASRLGKTFGTALKVGALAAATGLGAAAVASVNFVKVAADQNEALNKVSVLFDEHTGIIQDFAASSAKSFGISRRAAFDYTGTLGTILQASGLANKESADMSVKLTKLAADMASFNNIPIDVALEKIRAGLVGEAEPLRTVGVLLSETAVAQKGFEMGLVASGEKLNDAQKVQARYALIMEQTAKQQGDFTRTSDSLVNRQRILAAQFENIKATLGNALLPVATRVLIAFGDFIDLIETKVTPAISKFVGGFKAALNDPQVTSPGIIGLGQRLGVIFATQIIPAFQSALPHIRNLGRFLVRDALPHIVEFGRVAIRMGRDVAKFLFPALDTLADAWQNILRPALKFIIPLLRQVGQFLLEHKPLLLAVGAAILLLTNPWLAVIAVIAVVLAKWDEISQFFTKTIPEAIDSFLTKVKEIPIIGAIFEDAWNTVKAVIEFHVGLILAQAQFLFDSIKNAFDFFKAVFSGDWGAAWDAIKRQAEAIWNLLSSTFGLALDAIKTVAGSKLEMLKQVGSDIANAILDGLKALGGFALDIGIGFANAIIGAVNSIVQTINDAIPNSIPMPGPLPDIDLPDNPIPMIPMIGGGGASAAELITAAGRGFVNMQQGGFVPAGAVVPALLHGPEVVKPLSQVNAGGNTFVYAPTFSTASPVEAQRFLQWIVNGLRGQLA